MASITSSISSLLSGIQSIISGLIESILAVVTHIFNAIFSIFSTAWSAVEGLLKALVDAFSGLISTATHVVGDFVGIITGEDISLLKRCKALETDTQSLNSQHRAHRRRRWSAHGHRLFQRKARCCYQAKDPVVGSRGRRSMIQRSACELYDVYHSDRYRYLLRSSPRSLPCLCCLGSSLRPATDPS